MVIACIAIAAGLLFLPTAAAGAAVPTTPSSTLAETRPYRFDLARNFFNSPAEEVAARAEVAAAIAELDRLAERAVTRDSFIAAMVADDRAQRLFRKHDLYLFLRFAIDMREEAGLLAADDMRAKLRAARGKFKRTVVANGTSWFDGALPVTEQMARARFFLGQARRESDHLLSAEQQQVVDALEPLIGGNLYSQVVSDLKFVPVAVRGKKLDPRRDNSRLEADPSLAVRRAASRNLFAGYATRRDQLADLLIRAIKGGDAIAKLRRHGGALEQAAFDAYVTPDQYRALLANVARSADLFKDWQSRIPDPFARQAHWSAAEASALIVKSSTGVSPNYAAEFAALLDPASGRADLGGPGKRLPIQGTASVYPIGVSAIYMQDYHGDLLDLIILAHESGHAVQAQLMFRAGVPIALAAGPGYFTESFGRFQELVTLDLLYREAKKPTRRAWLRDALAARLLSVFNSAEEAAVELAIHDSVRAGTATSADDLDKVTASASSRFTKRIAEKPETRGVWMMSEGYFQASFQELNDVVASLLAVRYYQLYRQDRARFGPAYMALLSGGYGDTPANLLRRNLRIDMADSTFASATLAALRIELAALYRNQGDPVLRPSVDGPGSPPSMAGSSP